VAVGMIGVGRQAYQVNLTQFLKMPDVQIVAICDADSWRLENAKKKIEENYGKGKSSGSYRGCQTYVDFNELLAGKDIDAVMISTPDHWHAPMALAAFEAGKDVSLEKPITRTIAEGRRISDAAKKLGRVFRVDSELRSTRSVHQAAELVHNGRIGQIRTVTVGVPGSDVPCPPQPEMPVPKELDYERWQGPAPRAPYTEKRVHTPKSYDRPGWMRNLFYCDGMITNWGAHLDDGAMWCTGLERTGPLQVEGTGTYPPPDSFWNVLLKFEIHYQFANGVRWTYRTEKPYFKIEGTEGWVWADFSKIDAEPASLLKEKVKPDGVRFRFKSDKQDFIDCVKSRQETLEPAEIGHRVTSLCHLGHIAIQLGEKLNWDPEKERFINNDAANGMIDKPIHAPRRV
jgi:myo-inositol 2-dehydrogenase / D-chiro-inositol 1-dehydrogenase